MMGGVKVTHLNIVTQSAAKDREAAQRINHEAVFLCEPLRFSAVLCVT
jgi:hypothetical protein